MTLHGLYLAAIVIAVAVGLAVAIVVWALACTRLISDRVWAKRIYMGGSYLAGFLLLARIMSEMTL